VDCGVALLGFPGAGRVRGRPARYFGTRVARELGAQRLEPAVQPERGNAVVAIIAFDAAQQLVVALAAQLEPGGEVSECRVGLAQVDVAREAVERLELLYGVGFDRRAQPLPDDTVEVHEDVAAEQLVQLPLPRSIAPREPLERGGLVVIVV